MVGEVIFWESDSNEARQEVFDVALGTRIGSRPNVVRPQSFDRCGWLGSCSVDPGRVRVAQ